MFYFRMNKRPEVHYLSCQNGLLRRTAQDRPEASLPDGDGRENVTIKINVAFFQIFPCSFQIAENVKCRRMSSSWFLGDRTQV